MKFEWDSAKAAENEKKHEISFAEASTVFGDPLAFTFQDPAHSEGESRLLTFGLSIRDRVLVVSHTERSSTIRIISARQVTRQERKIYEDE